MAALYSAGIVSVLLLTANATLAAGAATVVSKDNRVEVSGAGGAGWAAASAGQDLQVGDQLKTGEDSRATVRMTDGSILQLDELTTIAIKAPKTAGAGVTLSVPGGAAFFSNQGHSREVSVETPSANGAIRGTAFLLTVNPNGGQSEVSMIEGAFELSNSGGNVLARQGEQARAAGGGPAKGWYGDLGNTAPWYLVLEGQLPAVQSLRKVGKEQFLGTLPKAIKRYRQIAPQVSGRAAMVRKDWALDVLEEAFKAAGPDCGMRARILRSVIAAAPEKAPELTELAISLGPDCAGAFGGGGASPSSDSDGFGNPASLNNSLPPFPSIGGGGQGNVIAICHNGQTIFVSPQEAEAHLRNHGGDTLGACTVTPVTNR